MSHRYPRIYQMLKSSGHTPGKALEILILAKRHDRFAINWIKALRIIS